VLDEDTKEALQVGEVFTLVRLKKVHTPKVFHSQLALVVAGYLVSLRSASLKSEEEKDYEVTPKSHLDTF
jgi:hypothetical protein